MMHPVHARALVLAVIMAPVGLAFGLTYFALLREACARLVAGRRGTLALSCARLAAAVALMTLAAHWGAPALLALFAGFLLARSLAVRAARRTATGER